LIQVISKAKFHALNAIARLEVIRYIEVALSLTVGMRVAIIGPRKFDKYGKMRS
jgi:hypothetical protein